MLAHIASFLYAGGELGPDQEIDHRCHSESETCPGGFACPHRGCVNPSHLRAVTKTENQRANARYRSDSCRNDHSRAEYGWWQQKARGWERRCRACDADYARVYRARGT